MKKEGHLDFFKTSGTSPPELTCSCCNQIKSIDCFHKKPGRKTGRDSRCKECISKKKKTKYVATKGMDLVSGLKKLIEISTTCLKKRIEVETKRLDEVILWRQK